MTLEGRTPGREDPLRCDHCAKFISHNHQTDIYNLEGIVSAGLEIDWTICGKCFKKHPARDRSYWDGWVQKKTAPPPPTYDEQRQAREEANRQKLQAMPSYAWIAEKFGADFANIHNQLRLAEFLDDECSTFEGMVSRAWEEPCTRLDCVTGEGVDFARLKATYQQDLTKQ